ncbi:hypothetical protein BDV12DRAFT_177425 [Aspergillus spectabilis]
MCCAFAFGANRIYADVAVVIILWGVEWCRAIKCSKLFIRSFENCVIARDHKGDVEILPIISAARPNAISFSKSIWRMWAELRIHKCCQWTVSELMLRNTSPSETLKTGFVLG